MFIFNRDIYLAKESLGSDEHEFNRSGATVFTLGGSVRFFLHPLSLSFFLLPTLSRSL
jgi:hypothetical protein